ncbi:MAG: hypothetical protein F9K40_12455 [Kofleriaceae bacterium]|nr:MAG: hypothetical protein F9K40_12455 [Kofleriaceae bacterium]MBZ0232886.1 hypothetical protein [Kofleriaceae bacterium]
MGAYAIPPAAWITFRSGTPLKVADVPLRDGMFEVTPISNDTYRVRGGGRVFFAREHQIADGVLARRGAAAALRGLHGGKLGVYPSNNRPYLVPCDAIAAAPLDGVSFDQQPVPRGKLRVVLEYAALVDGNQSEIWQLGPGQQVELLSVDGDHAEVRFERDGYLYRGRVVRWADDGTLVSGVDLLGSTEDLPWPETRIEQNAGGDAVVMLGRYSPPMQSFGASCSGTAILRARSPMLSGPLLARDRRSNNSLVREIPALERDLQIKLRSVFEDYRAIEIAAPAPEVTSIVAWVRAFDLDRPTCAAPEATPGP